MSARNRYRKEQNKAYRIAGEIHWTEDMEKSIRRIHKERRLYLICSCVCFGIIILETLALVGVIR